MPTVLRGDSVVMPAHARTRHTTGVATPRSLHAVQPAAIPGLRGHPPRRHAPLGLLPVARAWRVACACPHTLDLLPHVFEFSKLSVCEFEFSKRPLININYAHPCIPSLLPTDFRLARATQTPFERRDPVVYALC
jgi:hypothetical protein